MVNMEFNGFHRDPDRYRDKFTQLTRQLIMLLVHIHSAIRGQSFTNSFISSSSPKPVQFVPVTDTKQQRCHYQKDELQDHWKNKFQPMLLQGKDFNKWRAGC